MLTPSSPDGEGTRRELECFWDNSGPKTTESVGLLVVGGMFSLLLSASVAFERVVTVMVGDGKADQRN